MRLSASHRLGERQSTHESHSGLQKWEETTERLAKESITKCRVGSLGRKGLTGQGRNGGEVDNSWCGEGDVE